VSARIARAERFFGATGATLAHGDNRAFYRLSTDSIVLPLFETFRKTSPRRIGRSLAKGAGQRVSEGLDRLRSDSGILARPPMRR
jgi:antirestriction protein ArdC